MGPRINFYHKFLKLFRDTKRLSHLLLNYLSLENYFNQFRKMLEVHKATINATYLRAMDSTCLMLGTM